MAVAASRQTVVMHLQQHADKIEELAGNVDVLLESIMDSAEVLERSKEDGKVDTCRNATKELIALQAQIRGSAVALKRVADSYEAPASGNTDFTALLEEAEDAGSVQCEPEQHEEYQALEERLWNVHHAGEPMPGTEEAFGDDEDIIMEGSRRDISKNPKCPITGVEMLNLKEPVEDDMGFVYEKAAIFHWLSTQSGSGRIPVRAPIAAVRHTITMAGLKKATKVIRAQKQKQRMPVAQAAAQEDILDV